MNPLPPLLSLIAIAGGVLGGYELASAVAPELPSQDREERAVAGGASDSLFRLTPLFRAEQRAERELGEGRRVAAVNIEPGNLEVTPAAGRPGELPLDDLPHHVPEQLIAGINRARDRVRASRPITLDDVRSLRWRPTAPTRSEWRILLDPETAGPPSELVASRDGSRVRVAGGGRG